MNPNLQPETELYANTHPDSHPDSDQLSAFAENALPNHERAATLAHLSTCAHCRQVVFLAQQAEMPELAAQFQNTVISTGAKRSGEIPASAPSPHDNRNWRDWFRLTPLLGAATAALGCTLVFAGIFLHHRSLSTSAPPTTTANNDHQPSVPTSPEPATTQGTTQSPAPTTALKPLPPQERSAPPPIAFANKAAAAKTPALIQQNAVLGGIGMSGGLAGMPAGAAYGTGTPPVIPPSQIHGSMAGAASGSGQGYVSTSNGATASSSFLTPKSPSAPPPPHSGPGGPSVTQQNQMAQLQSEGQALQQSQAASQQQRSRQVTGLEARAAAPTLATAAAAPAGALATAPAAVRPVMAAPPPSSNIAAVPAPAPPALDSITSDAATVAIDNRNVNTLAYNTTRTIALSKQRATTAVTLPSHLQTASQATAAGRTVAIDAAGAVFLSTDAGHHWIPVKNQWQGTPNRVDATPPPPAAIAPQTSEPKADDSAAPTTPRPVFRLTTTANRTYTSPDGQTWRQP